MRIEAAPIGRLAPRPNHNAALVSQRQQQIATHSSCVKQTTTRLNIRLNGRCEAPAPIARFVEFVYIIH